MCLGLLAVPAALGGTVQHQGTTWGPEFLNVKLPRGFVACARFLRGQAPANALVQDSDIGEQSHILGSLAQRRSFLARPDEWERVGKRFGSGSCAEARRQLERLKQATTLADLGAGVRATGIRWYLRRPGDRLAWPPEVCARPAFQADGYQVYDLQALLAAPPGPAHELCRPGSP
jgi:hypothetical protein